MHDCCWNADIKDGQICSRNQLGYWKHAKGREKEKNVLQKKLMEL